MRTVARWLAGGLWVVLLSTGTYGGTHLKVGDQAPEFSLPATTGGKISLSDFRGKQTVVLAFFPAAFTGGCTQEAKSYQQHLEEFQKSGAQVLMVSTDNLPSLQRWAQELGVSFPLLSDFMRETARAYGVLIEERGIANRTTFVIDPSGRIVHIEEGKLALDPSGALTACRRTRP